MARQKKSTRNGNGDFEEVHGTHCEGKTEAGIYRDLKEVEMERRERIEAS